MHLINAKNLLYFSKYIQVVFFIKFDNYKKKNCILFIFIYFPTFPFPYFYFSTFPFPIFWKKCVLTFPFLRFRVSTFPFPCYLDSHKFVFDNNLTGFGDFRHTLRASEHIKEKRLWSPSSYQDITFKSLTKCHFY